MSAHGGEGLKAEALGLLEDLLWWSPTAITALLQGVVHALWHTSPEADPRCLRRGRRWGS